MHDLLPVKKMEANSRRNKIKIDLSKWQGSYFFDKMAKNEVSKEYSLDIFNDSVNLYMAGEVNSKIQCIPYETDTILYLYFNSNQAAKTIMGFPERLIDGDLLLKVKFKGNRMYANSAFKDNTENKYAWTELHKR